MKPGFWGLVALLCIPIGSSVRAQTITTLFNTGVDSTGMLATPGNVDLHYALISVPTGSGYTTAYVATSQPGGYPTTTTSQWIGPGADLNQGYASGPGSYEYQTTFDLTGFVPSTAALTGEISADDSAEIFLNGVDTGIGSYLPGYNSFKSFTINTGFITGINTLDIYVPNTTGGPTGLNLVISGSANYAVPEPGTIALCASFALTGLAFQRRRRAR